MKLYDEINTLLPTLHGWCEFPKAATLANIVLSLKPAVAVEIGVWGGRSLFPIALAMKQLNHGKVLAIDPWSAKASSEGQITEADLEWWSNVANHELVYQHFMHTIERLGLGRIVEVHRDKSEAIDIPHGIGLLHIDNNHGEQGYAETIRLAPKVALHGYVILDDLNWIGGHVQRAADWLTSNGFVHMHNLGTGAAYMRI